MHGHVTLISCSPEAAAIIASGGRISTMDGTADEIYAKSLAAGQEKNEKLIGKVLSSGHTSVLEHCYVNLSFENVSVLAEQFLIEFRLASFTVKSRRYVDFSGAGYVAPDFSDPAQAAAFDAAVRALFGIYDELEAAGVPKEDARFVLPYCFCSNFFCSMNARELVHVMNELTYGRGSGIPELRALGESLFAQCEARLPFLALRKPEVYRRTPDWTPQAAQPLVPDAPVIVLSVAQDAGQKICDAYLLAHGLAPQPLREDEQTELLKTLLARPRRRELEHHREASDMMFAGMARVVERFAVCDLDHDRYQYHERHGEPLYQPEGSYQQMLEQISRKYVVLTDSENAKIPQMLAPENLRRLIKTDNDSLKLEYAARDKSAFFMMTVVPMAWKGDRLTRVMMIVQDMGKQHLLQSLANTDGLTGLLNKRYFDRVLTVLEQHSQPFALFYMDLDRFKPVNDTYGHDVGDELLKGVSQRLQGCIRSRDYAFRLGGDEFALLLIGPMGPEACASKMNLICEMIAVPYEIEGNTVSVGASCGYALYPAESVDVQQVRCIADQRMYENKQANHARQDGAEDI